MVGLVASALVIELVPTPNDTYPAMFVLLGVVLVILQTRPRRNVTTRGNVEGIPLDEVPFVPALLMITPWQCLVVITVASLAGSIVLRRQWLKAAFNLGSLLLSGAVGIAVVALLHVSPQERPGITEVAVVGDRPDLVAAVQRRYLPNAVLAWGEPYASPLWEGRRDGFAYVCRQYACQAPVDTPDALDAQLVASGTVEN